MDLLPVQEALDKILAAAGNGTATETIPVTQAFGRTLAQDLLAQRTQPPVALSAMDGYAVRAADIANIPSTLSLAGESAAGHSFAGKVLPGSCVRIFTGAPVPDGADTVVIQENVVRDGSSITILSATAKGRHIRAAGIDFSAGERLLPAGTRLDAASLSLAAAMNHSEISVRKRPRIGILATGDELVAPGSSLTQSQIIASNNLAVGAIANEAGTEVFDLGIAVDQIDVIADKIQQARDLDLDVLVTLGGASVGDHDLVQKALLEHGVTPDFWRIAMRPGKPMMFGKLPGSGKSPISEMKILGLPGNPVASYVCALIFLKPLLRALVDDPDAGRDWSEPAVLGRDLPANDKRQDYLRATLVFSQTALPVVTPFALQDSSILSSLAKADALLIREPFAPAEKMGNLCRILRLK